MPYVACPSCGERGKIPPSLIGARIKCKKCGVAFNVASAPARAAEAPAGVAPAESATVEALGVHHDGIAVEGLDAASWSLANDQSSDTLKAVAEIDSGTAEVHAIPSSEPLHAARPKEYKLICSRDKIFEGKFDLARLEEALNLFARQGWIVKAMTTPHLKGFGDATKEEIVVLLER